MRYRWLARPDLSDGGSSATVDMPEPVRFLVQRRGISEEFLEASFEGLSGWHELPGALDAAEVIRKTLDRGDRILVHGDFDADGITATATAVRALRELGGDVSWHLPCRFEEGYGLGDAGVEKCREEKAGLLLTVDCGITAADETGRIRSNGAAVVVTDHHLPESELPCADALVDPALYPDEGQPWRHLSGAGVIHAVLRGLFPEPLPDVMEPDLVAIGTVCDLVEIRGDNRRLVRRGLDVVSSRPGTGLKALLARCSLSGASVTAGDIAFQLGPRINSAGRIAHADTALRLLLEDDRRVAEELAMKLDSFNSRRRELDEAVFRSAVTQIGEGPVPVAIAGSGEWHPGVIGISASRIARKYNRPAILVSWDGDTGTGSARGLPGMEVHGILASAMEEGHLIRFGGHSMAAGLTVSRSSWDEFRKFVLERAEEEYAGGSQPVLFIDGPLLPSQCTMEVLKALDSLEPFGRGNPEPVWIARGLYPSEFRSVGKNGKHLQMTFRKDGVTLRAVGFNMGSMTSGLDRPLDLAFRLKADGWRGGDAVQLVLEDFRPSLDAGL